jgi:hypothetical protein
MKVAAYVARQSLLSSEVSADLEGVEDDLGLPHAFQRRMIVGDWSGDLWGQISDAQSASIVDLILWDIVDERHGVYVMPDGGVVTRSIDLLGSEYLKSLVSDAELVPFGTDEHFKEWAAAAGRFAARLRREGLMEKTVVLDVPWAESSVDGTPVPGSMGVSAEEANRLYARYYERLRELGFDMLSVGEPVRSDPHHKWGHAPFHYAPDVYGRIIEGLQERLSRAPAGNIHANVG